MSWNNKEETGKKKHTRYNNEDFSSEFRKTLKYQIS